MWRKYTRPFEGSVIRPQDLPVKKKRGGAKTKSGKIYTQELSKIRNWITGLKNGISGTKISTIMAFCKNYFIKYQEFPSREDLRRIFKF